MRERITYAIGALLVVAIVFVWTVRSAGEFIAVWFPIVGPSLGVNPLLLLAEIAAVAVIVVFIARAIR